MVRRKLYGLHQKLSKEDKDSDVQLGEKKWAYSASATIVTQPIIAKTDSQTLIVFGAQV